MKFFDLDTPFMQKVTKYTSLVIMNTWWFLCCLPIVTIGASTAAMYAVTFEIRENGSATTGEFFRAFRDNFKKGTLLWLALLGSAVLLALCYLAVILVANAMVRAVLAALVSGLFLLWLLAAILVFPLTAYFENTVINTLHNAVLIALRYMRRVLPCGALTILPPIFYILAPDFFVRILILWVFIFAGLIVYLKSKPILSVFREISGEDEEETDEEAREEISDD